LKRKVLFDSGIDFCNLNKFKGDIFIAKKGGIDDFKKESLKIDVDEINIDL